MREELYNKLAKEYLEYEDKLKQLSIQEIIEKSYETAIKQEMTYYFDSASDYFNDEQIKVINKLEHPLDELYDGLRSQAFHSFHKVHFDLLF